MKRITFLLLSGVLFCAAVNSFGMFKIFKKGNKQVFGKKRDRQESLLGKLKLPSFNLNGFNSHEDDIHLLLDDEEEEETIEDYRERVKTTAHYLNFFIKLDSKIDPKKKIDPNKIESDDLIESNREQLKAWVFAKENPKRRKDVRLNNVYVRSQFFDRGFNEKMSNLDLTNPNNIYSIVVEKLITRQDKLQRIK